VHFKKAYDSVTGETLCKIAIELGIPKKLTTLIKTCLHMVSTDVSLSTTADIPTGKVQGRLELNGQNQAPFQTYNVNLFMQNVNPT
jgi:hypothetical protein